MFSPPLLPRTFEAALRDLRSPSPAARREALADLVRHPPSDAREDAIAAALGDPDGSVRAAAAGAAADAGLTALVPELLELVGDDDGRARQMAITALGELGDERAAERLERALSDERADVRFQATIAFPRVCGGAARAWSALERSAKDRDPEVARVALRVADEVSAREGVPVPGALLSRAGELLRAGDPGLRLAAAILLAECGDDRGAPVLLAAARRELGALDPEDEAAAIDLLGALGAPAAVPVLERRAGRFFGLLRDPHAWHVRVALARLGHARSRQAILRDLASSDAAVRVPAIVAAGRARLGEARARLTAMRARGDEPGDAIDEALTLLEGAA